jgi:hypothetical protein
VCAQNAIFCSQVFVLEKQFLIDQTGDVGEQAYPFVFFHLEPPSYPASSIRSDFLPLRAEEPEIHCVPGLGALFAVLGLGTIQDFLSRGQGTPDVLVPPASTSSVNS